jgi:hypothetical protein
MWDLATAKTKVNIAAADTTSDAALQHVLDLVAATVEKLLGRGLFLRRQTDTFYRFDTNGLLLSRYPIRQIYSVNGKSGSFSVHNRMGYLYLDCAPHYFPNGKCCITVDYEGGFSQLPSDLEGALWEAFAFIWTKVDHVTGAPVGGGGATIVQGKGEVDRITLTDFGTVSFNYGTASVGDSGIAAAAAQQAHWNWLAPWAYLLETYRSEASPVGTAFA